MAKELSPLQIEAVHLWLTRRANGMKAEDVACAVKVDRRTLFRWRQSAAWREYESTQAVVHARSHMADVLEVLVEKALTGHAKSMELYLKVVHLIGNDAKPLAVETEDNSRSTEQMEAELAELHRLLAETKGETYDDTDSTN